MYIDFLTLFSYYKKIKDNKSYLFTFEDFKVINLKKQKCESEGHYEDDLIEFKRDITDNTYMISND